MKNKFPTNNIWVLLVIVLLGIIYQFSNTYAYVDGDDATSIAYHLMGRDKALQPPYSPYHGMMDKFLSILPANDEIMRTAAFGITRYANILMVILILLLTFNWMQALNKNLSALQKALISVIVLLAAPEIPYLGLVYSPTLVAMCIVLSAHLILRWAYPASVRMNRNKLMAHLGALILFGFGIAFRWNVIAYGLVIVTDLFILQPTSEPIRKRLFVAAGWGTLALLSAFIMINLSGYGFADIFGAFDTILHVVNQVGTLSSGNTVSLKEVLMRSGLTLSPLLSPILILFILIGCLKLALSRTKLTFVILAGFLSILPWAKSGVPKFIITVLPALIFAFVYGLVFVLDYLKQKPYKNLAYAFLVIGLLFPWLVGIQVDREETAWGPGFEIKPYTYADTSGMQFHIAFAPGMAFPTPEGARVLYGHGYVFFGQWNKFIATSAAERQNAINTALELDIPLLVTSWSPDYYLDILYAMGFKTTDPYNKMAADGYFHERKFTNPQGKTISVLFHETAQADISELISHLEKYPNSQKIVLIGYSQTMHTLYKNRPSILNILGATSALVDLSQVKVK